MKYIGSPEDKPLTLKESKFLHQYLRDFNATRSVQAAGFKVTPESARVYGTRLLAKVNVKKALQLKVQEMQTGEQELLMRLKREMERLAFFDVRTLFDENGNLKNIADLDDDESAALASLETFEEFADLGDGIKVKTGDTKKVRLWSKEKALDMLAKYAKMYSDAPTTNVQVNNILVSKEELLEAKQIFNDKY